MRTYSWLYFANYKHIWWMISHAVLDSLEICRPSFELTGTEVAQPCLQGCKTVKIFNLFFIVLAFFSFLTDFSPPLIIFLLTIVPPPVFTFPFILHVFYFSSILSHLKPPFFPINCPSVVSCNLHIKWYTYAGIKIKNRFIY